MHNNVGSETGKESTKRQNEGDDGTGGQPPEPGTAAAHTRGGEGEAAEARGTQERAQNCHAAIAHATLLSLPSPKSMPTDCKLK